ncbi:MAG: hypothetical protein B6D64_08830 [Bacteroidetes bacterium 4484_276]|nr:MAG: hypothetical protein B6D64_08830 [Bacteroidetes bacterium 4484_276]RLD74120.1 MAG: hypothetical protein DRI87_02015 [Bacteroidota bacterium]
MANNNAIKAQIMSLPDSANFFDYMEAFYNSDMYNPADSNEGGAKAQHDRLNEIWGKRLYPHGDFSIANKAIIEYAENFEPVNTRDENPNWICLGPSDNPANSTRNGVGQIHRITFDPNYDGINNRTIYACSGYGGLWRTENDGELWENVNTDYLPMTTVADVAVSPNNSDTLFIATGLPDGGVELQYSPNWANVNPIYTYGIYRSNDYGNTWDPINTGFINEFYNKGGTIRKLTIDKNNPNVLFAATSNGVYRTQNALAADPVWNNVFDGITDTDDDFRSIEYKPGSSDTLYAASSNIFISTDGGTTWQVMTGEETGLDFEEMGAFYPYRINLAVTPAADEKLYAYIWGDDETLPDPQFDNKSAYIYIYDGNSWSEYAFHHGYNAKEWMGMAVSPVDDDFIFAYGDFGSCSKHAGVHAPYPNHGFLCYLNYIGEGFYADVHILSFQPNVDSPKLFIGHHAGVSMMDVESFTGPDPDEFIVEFRNSGLQNMLQWTFDDSEFEPDAVITGNQDCYVYLYRDNYWNVLAGGGDSYNAKFSKNDNNLLFTSRTGDNSVEELKAKRYFPSSPWIYDPIPSDGEHPANKTLVPKTYQVKGFPNDTSDYFGFSEIYKRNYNWSAGHSADELWNIDSDLGKIEPVIFKRQISEFDYCQKYPEYIYVATGGVFKEDFPSTHPILARTTIGGNNGDYNSTAFSQLNYPGIDDENFPVISGIAVHPENPDKVWISLIGYDNIDIRVAYTENGGQDWLDADPNKSLPELPVNNIVYQYGSNDVLYIATDAGVYYKDASMDHWEEYGNFPHVRVTELKINYCQGKLRAATFGRSLWEADLLPMENPVCYAINNGENLVWSNEKVLQTGVRVKAGGHLTVTGVIYMPEGGKIIVEPGGKLTLDGGIFTNGCGKPWQGIELQGTANQPQTPEYQGVIEITNGGIIENADIGIITIRRENYGGGKQWVYNMDFTGGIIHAENAVFINNNTAVMFFDYNYTSDSYFNDCLFETNDNMSDAMEPYYFLRINGMKGVNISNCNFINNSSTPHFGGGIYSLNAQYNVEGKCLSGGDDCTEWDNGLFQNLNYGIYATETSPVKFIMVRHNEFSDNYKSVYINGMTGALIKYNNFSISVPFIENGGYGLYLDNSTDYTVEENLFHHNDGNGPNTGIGMIVNNSGTDANEIYRNWFSGLELGVSAQKINRLSGALWPIQGLQLRCNDFENCRADILIPAEDSPGPSDISGISPWQGAKSNNPEDMAGNLFYIPNQTPDDDYDDINNQLGHITYFFPFNNNNNRVKPVDYTHSSVTLYPITLNTQWTYENGCPSSTESDGNSGSTTGELKSQLAQYGQQADSVENLLTLLVDGGNTEAVQSEVDNSSPPETMEVYNQLMSESPYLSDTVVSTAIEKEDVLPAVMMRDIMVANPHTAKSDHLLNKLGERNNPLPDYMIGQILQGRSILSLKEETESRWERFTQQKSKAFRALVRYYLNDTASSDSLQALLVADSDLKSSYTLSFLYLEQHMFDEGLTVLNDIPIQFNLSPEQEATLEHTTGYFNMLASLIQQGKSPLETDSTQTALLHELETANTGQVSAYARSILKALNQTDYTEPVYVPDADRSEHAENEYEQLLNKVAEAPRVLTIQPNPAKDYIIVGYDFVEQTHAEITITSMKNENKFSKNVNGLKDQFTVDTRDWTPGIYIATVIINDQERESVKFSVVQ